MWNHFRSTLYSNTKAKKNITLWRWSSITWGTSQLDECCNCTIWEFPVNPISMLYNIYFHTNEEINSSFSMMHFHGEFETFFPVSSQKLWYFVITTLYLILLFLETQLQPWFRLFIIFSYSCLAKMQNLLLFWSCFFKINILCFSNIHKWKEKCYWTF